jgi:MFS family permease
MRTKILGIGVAVWSLLTAASGFAGNYAMLFVTRLGVGVGEAACAPAGNSLIGDLFPPSKRARALSVFMLGLPVGIFLAYLISGRVAAAYGWRWAFYIALIPGLILAVLAFMIREPRRGAAEAHAAATAHHEENVDKFVLRDHERGTVWPWRPRFLSYWLVLSIPTLWWIIASGAFHNFNMYAVNSFLTAFLSRYHGLSLTEANNISAVVLGAVGVIGLIGGGWAADRLRQKRPNGRLMLSAVALLLSAPAVYFALNQPKGSLTAFIILMGIGSTFMFVYYATVYAAIQDVVAPSLRGTAMALYFFAMYVLGASVGPVGTGMLSDHYANQAMVAAGATVMSDEFKAAGLHSAMYIIPALSLLTALVLLAASRTVASDMEKLQRWLRDSAAKPAPEPATAEAAN